MIELLMTVLACRLTMPLHHLFGTSGLMEGICQRLLNSCNDAAFSSGSEAVSEIAF